MLFDETSYQRRHQTEEHIFLVCAFCYFFLQKSIWHRSGPWVLKFSVHPNMMISRTLCSILCAFSNFHPLFLATFVRKISFAKIQHFFCHTLQPHKIVCIHTELPALHIIFHYCQMYSDDAIRQIFNQLCAIECLSLLGILDSSVDIKNLPISHIEKLWCCIWYHRHTYDIIDIHKPCSESATAAFKTYDVIYDVICIYMILNTMSQEKIWYHIWCHSMHTISYTQCYNVSSISCDVIQKVMMSYRIS